MAGKHRERTVWEPVKPEETLPAETGTGKETTAPEKETSTGVDLLPQESASVVPAPTADGKVLELLGEIVDILRETEPETTMEETEEVPPPYTQPLHTMQLQLAVLVFGVSLCFGALLAKFFWKGVDHGST